MTHRCAGDIAHDIGDEEPIRLALAAKLAFPDGSMGVSGLRREAARGHLEIERIAGKDYTTLRAIREMRDKCRVNPKAPVSGCNQRDGTSTDTSSSKRSGASETAASSEALVSARASVRKLKEHSRNTSAINTEPHASVSVTRLPLK